MNESAFPLWLTFAIAIIGGGIVGTLYQWYRDRRNDKRIKKMFTMEIRMNVEAFRSYLERYHLESEEQKYFPIFANTYISFFNANSNLLYVFDESLVEDIMKVYSSLGNYERMKFSTPSSYPLSSKEIREAVNPERKKSFEISYEYAKELHKLAVRLLESLD